MRPTLPYDYACFVDGTPFVQEIFRIGLLTINFKTSAKCRLQLESPLGDSQTKFSARNSLCTPSHGA